MVVEQLQLQFDSAPVKAAPFVPDHIFRQNDVTDLFVPAEKGALICTVTPKIVNIRDEASPDQYFFIAEIKQALNSCRLQLNVQTHIPGQPRTTHSREHTIFAWELFQRSMQHFNENGFDPGVFFDEWWDDSDSWQYLRITNMSSPDSIKRNLYRSFSVRCALALGMNHMSILERESWDEELKQEYSVVQFSRTPNEFSYDLTSDMPQGLNLDRYTYTG